MKGGAARTNAGQPGGWQVGKGQEGLEGLKAAVRGTAPGLPHSSIGEELEPRILCPLQMLIFGKIFLQLGPLNAEYCNEISSNSRADSLHKICRIGNEV